MLDDINNAVSLGKNIADSDGLTIGDSAFDFSSGLLDGTPIGKIIDFPMNGIERGLSQIEKIKIVESVKQKFHIYISQKAANSVSAFTTPSVRAAERSALLQGKAGRDWMTNAEQIYKTHQASTGYKIQRKLQDKVRILKKKPLKVAKIPLSFVPLGDAASLGIKVGEYIVDKYAEKRKTHKKEEYLAAGNKNVLVQKLGISEYNRKQAKWTVKDIAELGPTIQRNLYKLKQSVEILNAKSEHLNSSIQQHLLSKSHATQKALNSSRESTAMSVYEVKHYIEKISAMCKTMEATAFTINTYMEGLKQVTDDCHDGILKSF